jgi:hypothetical protein
MLSLKEIMFVHLLFSSCMGFVALWLFFAAVKRPSPSKRAELFLCVRKGGVLFRKIPVRKGHYRIGRGMECDITLEGMGIPLLAGELRAATGFVYRNFASYPVMKNNLKTPPEFEVQPGDELEVYSYSMKLESN